ncbi:cysteine proteinase 1-like [Oryza brachyantha]|uniref:cysteine proteinase 1-like n=1 Tax=Oryza brachyantha TaxID=4533 RepID=UPI001ADCD6DD|nr:cysteine proteinase 1-like [Oryza brachyantha]
MARHRLLAAVAALLLFAAAATVVRSAEEEDALIEQVVGGGDGDGDDRELGELLDAEAHFASFERRFGRTYRDAGERAYRLSVFRDNLRRARRHQRLDPTAAHGVTKFSDLTPAEFRERYLGLRGGGRTSLASTAEAPILPTDGLPADFDWREHGAVGPVKDQGSCGSCWSFSTSGALEGAHYLATGKLEVLSEQQMVDCDHECDPSESRACDSGCNGGLMTTAFSYLMKSGGLQSEKDYPYAGRENACKFDKSKIVAQVKNFSVVSANEDQIAANLVKHGPLAIGINAVFMQTYIGGVSCPYICGKHLDHGVLLVGYGSAGYAPIRFKEKPYWIIKNSWGENWGENGYYKICRGPHVQNKCGVDSMVSTVTAIHTSKME